MSLLGKHMMLRFGRAVCFAVCVLVFHTVLVGAMVIAFMFTVSAANFAAGAPASGNEYIGYWIVSLVLTAASASTLWIWDIVLCRIGQRNWMVTLRRCSAIVGALCAFYVIDMGESFADAARYDRFLFAYASPAIAALIGLIYSDVSRSILFHIQHTATILYRRRNFRPAAEGADARC